MADPAGLDVNNVQVKQLTVLNPANGKSQVQHQVTYHIGNHGPFTDTYGPGQFTADAVKAGMNKNIATLRDITTAATTGQLNG